MLETDEYGFLTEDGYFLAALSSPNFIKFVQSVADDYVADKYPTFKEEYFEINRDGRIYKSIFVGIYVETFESETKILSDEECFVIKNQKLAMVWQSSTTKRLEISYDEHPESFFTLGPISVTGGPVRPQFKELVYQDMSLNKINELIENEYSFDEFIFADAINDNLIIIRIGDLIVEIIGSEIQSNFSFEETYKKVQNLIVI